MHKVRRVAHGSAAFWSRFHKNRGPNRTYSNNHHANYQLPSFPMRFGIAFGTAAFLAEGASFALNSSSDLVIIKPAEIARGVAGSFGVVLSTTTVAYLSAQKVLANHSNYPSAVVDALIARPIDSVKILTRAGGRVGIRAAFYFAAAKAASLGALVFWASGDAGSIVLIGPAAAFIFFLGAPFVMPLAGLAFVGGRLVGASLGSGALSQYLRRQAQGAQLGFVAPQPGLISNSSLHVHPSSASSPLVWGGLFKHKADALFASSPLACRVFLAGVAVVGMLPRTKKDLVVDRDGKTRNWGEILGSNDGPDDKGWSIGSDNAGRESGVWSSEGGSGEGKRENKSTPGGTSSDANRDTEDDDGSCEV